LSLEGNKWPGVVRWVSGFILLALLIGLFYNLSTFSIRKEIAVLAGQVGQRVIVLDPGHGGFDGGARGLGGVEEKEIVLAVAKYLAEYLEQVGARVFLTRDEDEELAEDKVEDLDARIKLAEEVAADLFLSIHANSFPSPYEYGAQCFYCHNHPGSKNLAREIQGALVEGIDVLGYNYREVQMAEYYILRNLEIPAALIEIGFLSNPREEALLRQGAYQKRLAWCIFIGVVRYFSGSWLVEDIVN
jgi:N-acetylmuramoyl-L-alanine amidase